MILKASQRGGGKQLALHLLNSVDNEHVELHDLRGFVSADLVGAMKEAHAVSLGTRCSQFLFSVSLNPPPNENVPPEVFEDALARIEAKTGLTGQPRAVVFHEKDGRRHCHAVYSRINADSMKAINLSHFKLKLRDISKQLYMEHEWRLPAGLVDSQARSPLNYTLAEYQQAKRMGRDARDLKAMVQECWAASDSAPAFAYALRERGLTLARGDRRGHVAVTHEGEVLALARLLGRKTKELRARLGEPDALPSVDQAKAEAAKGMSVAFARHIEEAKAQHRQAMEPLDTRRWAMTQAHRVERQTLDAGQKRRWEAEARERSGRLNKGLRGVWDRLTGRHAETQRRNVAEAAAALDRDRQQRQELIAEQLAERRELQREIAARRAEQAALLRELRADRAPYRDMPERDGRQQGSGGENAERQPQSPIPARTPALRQRFGDAAKSDAARQRMQERVERYRSRGPHRDPEQDLER